MLLLNCGHTILGEKHLNQVKNYIPKEFKIGNLEALIRKHDSWILGLSRIEEYTLPDYESGNIEKNERIKVSMIKMAKS